MPVTQCRICSGNYQWSWTEAFEKFGFGDGDGQVETYQVVEILVDAGYDVIADDWGLHNTIIVSIKRDGCERIPHDNSSVRFGYDDPRDYLPADIVAVLDRALPDTEVLP